jgi:hypothetical protein
MKNPKPYKYRSKPIAAPEYNTSENVQRIGNQEVLSGQINGMKASDLEERVYRSLTKLEIPSEFRARVTSDALGQRRLTSEFANIRGEVEIDFLAERTGQTFPIFVDGEIGHFFTPYQAEQDKLKADIVNEFGSQFGWHEAIRIPFWKLIDQEMTDRTVRDLLG